MIHTILPTQGSVRRPVFSVVGKMFGLGTGYHMSHMSLLQPEAVIPTARCVCEGKEENANARSETIDSGARLVVAGSSSVLRPGFIYKSVCVCQQEKHR